MKMGNRRKKQAFNPYLPSYEYVPDAEPRVFGDRLYVYGSHDLFRGADFCLGDYVCWSAPTDDLGNWQFEGTIYCKEQDPRNTEGKQHMCAPDVVQGHDGRFYLYYQLHALAITSVAVCDTPAGKYTFYGYVQHTDGTPWGEKKGDVFAFDPGVLVDGEKTWLYVGFSPKPGLFKTILKLRGNNVEEAVCLELESDMKTVKGGEHPIVPGFTKANGTEFEDHAFFEASSIRKIKDKYYYVYSSHLSHELCYAVSDFPSGGFRYGGTLISIGDIGYGGRKLADNYTGNTHGGMVELNGKWYVFYHRQTNLQKCARQGCAEALQLQTDGQIAQAELTSCGLNGGPLLGEGTYEARIACNLWSKEGTFPYYKSHEKNKKQMHPYFTQSGTDREQDDDQYIANMRDGAVAGYKYFQFAQDVMISVKVRGTGSGAMEIRTEEKGTPVCTIPLSQREQWYTFQAEYATPLQGVKPLFFVYKGDGFVDFKEFSLSGKVCG